MGKRDKRQIRQGKFGPKSPPYRMGTGYSRLGSDKKTGLVCWAFGASIGNPNRNPLLDRHPSANHYPLSNLRRHRHPVSYLHPATNANSKFRGRSSNLWPILFHVFALLASLTWSELPPRQRRKRKLQGYNVKRQALVRMANRARPKAV